MLRWHNLSRSNPFLCRLPSTRRLSCWTFLSEFFLNWICIHRFFQLLPIYLLVMQTMRSERPTKFTSARLFRGCTHTEKSFQNHIEIRLYLPLNDCFGTKRTSVWIQINRKMLYTIWFRFDLIRFWKYFSVKIFPRGPFHHWYASPIRLIYLLQIDLVMMIKV